MKKEYIMIVDPISTGSNFLIDIIRRGFRPVGLWSNRNSIIFNEMKNVRNAVEKQFRDKADFFVECNSYEETLKKVKAYSPKFIIPGGEVGVELAIKLSNDLGLRGNPIESMPALTNKFLMNERLFEHGIRSVRGKLVHNWEEAAAFYKEQGLKGCVLKPYRGAGSFGVRVCDNEEELKEAFNEVFAMANIMDDGENAMLLQEKIDGMEYVVNTISYDGYHKISSVWKYTKKTVEGGGKVYNICESVERPEIGYTDLVRYTLDVLKALGVMNGNVHTELMVDEKGPVLIEVNCRVIGGGFEAEFLDKAFGHHETDILLDTYLHPEKFMEDLRKPYKSQAVVIMKSIIAPKDFEVRATPICSLAKHLKSYYSLGINKHVSDHINRTVDLDTCPAHVYLTSENYGELKRDYELLERIEVECFDMLFTEESAKPEDMPKDLMSIEDVIKSIDPIGGVLVFSNEKKTIEGVTCVGEDEIGSEMAGYEYGFFDLNYRENEDYEAVIDLFFELANKVRKGGYIVVPKRSYWHLPHRIKAVEALSEVGGFYVEPPTLDNEEVIIIRKN